MPFPVGSGVRRNGWLAAALVAPPAVLLMLRRIPAIDVAQHSVHFHLVIVSSIAACALTVAVLASVAAARVRQSGIVLLAAGCLICGVLMFVHGVVTPGVSDRPYNLWVSRAPVLAVLGFAVCQGAAVLLPKSRASHVLSDHPVLFLGALSVVLGTFAAIVITDATALRGTDALPREDDLAKLAALASVAILLPTAWQHWRRYRLGLDPVQFALTIAATMSIAAVGSMRYGRLWHLSWWDYHVYLLGGFAAAAFTIFLRYRATRTVDSVLDAAFAVDPLEHISRSYPDELRDLVRAVEVKDSYTHGHSRRTAELATALGTRLGLAPEELRLLAQGAYLHDVGKIVIPDEILNKPGHLTPDERTIIETHAEVGAGLVEGAESLAGCVDVVRHHHERFDGTGYPDRVAGRSIPLLARIAAVADVWDALTSDRAYRAGLSPEEALAHVVAGSGSHFDPVIVEALVDLAGEWGYRLPREVGDVETAWAAVQDCHETGDSRISVLSRR
jgi:putative nucleotidyltransferase with HDIG domain